jgi:curved DNA-binding protein CbpA
MIGPDDLERLRAWTEVVEESSYYELLGVLDLADAAAIQAAFHEFALAFHPDLYESGTEQVRAAARYVFRRGAEAYRVLSDPELRPKYDLALARGHLRLLGGEPAQRVVEGALQSLDDLCKTPAARHAARRADELIGKGDLSGARRLLKDALAHDGYDNAALEERIEALDLALFAMGG